ncbi:WxcM-like domain-containing protein, partial [Duncaniella muris]|uniref:WxcM-like domain-containing protein n=1 Tax=Duncaniella muris TaxID=2094150 RepID=UPI002628D7FF
MDITKPCIIPLPRIYDPRGSLTFVQDNDQIPFEIARCYWTYDVPAGEARGDRYRKVRPQLLGA